jgi:hypothetical protein
MPGDLVGARYPTVNPAWSMFGQQTNLAQLALGVAAGTKSDIPMFTNWFPGAALSDTEAALKTKEITAVPVAVPGGIAISKVSVRVGATETETGTHFYVALYSGLTVPEIGGTGAKGEVKPLLLGQSKDVTEGTLLKPTTTYTAELEKPVFTTEGPEGNAPNGWIYVGIYSVATKPGSLATFAPAATALTKASAGLKSYPWFVGAPLPCIRYKPVESGTAPEHLEEATLVATAPIVFLT